MIETFALPVKVLAKNTVMAAESILIAVPLTTWSDFIVTLAKA